MQPNLQQLALPMSFNAWHNLCMGAQGTNRLREAILLLQFPMLDLTGSRKLWPPYTVAMCSLSLLNIIINCNSPGNLDRDEFSFFCLPTTLRCLVAPLRLLPMSQFSTSFGHQDMHSFNVCKTPGLDGIPSIVLKTCVRSSCLFPLPFYFSLHIIHYEQLGNMVYFPRTSEHNGFLTIAKFPS